MHIEAGRIAPGDDQSANGRITPPGGNPRGLSVDLLCARPAKYMA